MGSFARIPWETYRNTHSYSYLICYFPSRLNFIYLYENVLFSSHSILFSHSSFFPSSYEMIMKKAITVLKVAVLGKGLHSCPVFSLKMRDEREGKRTSKKIRNRNLHFEIDLLCSLTTIVCICVEESQSK